MAAQRTRSLAPLTRALASVPRTSLPLPFTSLPVSSAFAPLSSPCLTRSFTSSSLLQATPSTPATSASHDSHAAAAAPHGGHGHGGSHHSEDRSGPDYGIHFHEPEMWHKRGAQFFGGLLWFWLMYRASHDWKYLFFWENPFDSHDEHHDDEHGDKHMEDAHGQEGEEHH